MAKIIPNQNSWIGFTTTAPAGYSASTALAGSAIQVLESEIDGAVNLTSQVMSITASAQGNAIPTPALDSLFDRSIIGTSQASFQADFYRDNTKPTSGSSAGDAAWYNLSRGTYGYFLISRFGGLQANGYKPRATDTYCTLEVWPVAVTSRAASQMTSNTVQTFQLTGAVIDVPAELCTVGTSAGVPSVPFNVVATAGATGIAVVDWDVPIYTGTGITGYKVYKSTVAGGAGAYTEVTTSITKVGTTATLTGVTAGLTYFKVVATNAAGDSAQSAFASCTVV